jgi:peptidoglycan hydrolase-like amidase
MKKSPAPLIKKFSSVKISPVPVLKKSPAAASKVSKKSIESEEAPLKRI